MSLSLLCALLLAPPATSGDYFTHVPGGGTVEVIAITDGVNGWWSPDGTAIEPPPFKSAQQGKFFQTLAAKSETGYLLFLRQNSLPAGVPVQIGPRMVSDVGISSWSQTHEVIFDDEDEADDEIIAFGFATTSPRSDVKSLQVWIRSEEGQWQEFHRQKPALFVDPQKYRHSQYPPDKPVISILAETEETSRRYISYQPRKTQETVAANVVRAIVVDNNGEEEILRSQGYADRTYFQFEDSQPIDRPASAFVEVILEQRPMSNVYLSDIASEPSFPFTLKNWRTDERVQFVLIGIGGGLLIAVGLVVLFVAGKRERKSAE